MRDSSITDRGFDIWWPHTGRLNMRAFLIGALVALLAAPAAFAQSDHYVSGYTRKDGTYVAPHYQTNPNSTRNDNYSTRGNVNPYTGQSGTKPRDGETANPFGQTSRATTTSPISGYDSSSSNETLY